MAHYIEEKMEKEMELTVDFARYYTMLQGMTGSTNNTYLMELYEFDESLWR